MRQLIKYPGSKWSYANWIISMMPKHSTYLEPYFGSGAIFFNKKSVKVETINDLNQNVVNFFRVCRDYPEKLQRLMYLTPYSRSEYESITEDSTGEPLNLTGKPIEDARRFAIRCTQSFGNKQADRAGWKQSKMGTGSNNPLVWRNMAKEIIAMSERLLSAQIECRPAVEVIKNYNYPDCLIYADPPYPNTVRKGRIYAVEMLHESEHIEMLDALLAHSGPVILSGYDNNLYNDYLDGWHKEQTGGWKSSGTKITETLWMNYKPISQMEIEICSS